MPEEKTQEDESGKNKRNQGGHGQPEQEPVQVEWYDEEKHGAGQHDPA
jgi:hypothetical protein